MKMHEKPKPSRTSACRKVGGACVAGFILGFLFQVAVFNTSRHRANAFPSVNSGGSWIWVAMYREHRTDDRSDPLYGSQCGQDRTIAEIFQHKPNGTFVDLAANDATALSNTVELERKYGWNGLCVEPSLIYMRGYMHRKCRLVQAVAGPKDDLKVKFNFQAKHLGGIVGFDYHPTNVTESRYTVSVEKILRDFGMPRVIDYLSLDIEGAEAWAFEGFPWQTYTFLVVTVERPKDSLKSMLVVNGYTYLCNHGLFGDELWVHKSLQNFDDVKDKYGGRAECRNYEKACIA